MSWSVSHIQRGNGDIHYFLCGLIYFYVVLGKRRPNLSLILYILPSVRSSELYKVSIYSTYEVLISISLFLTITGIYFFGLIK